MYGENRYFLFAELSNVEVKGFSLGGDQLYQGLKYLTFWFGYCIVLLHIS